MAIPRPALAAARRAGGRAAGWLCGCLAVLAVAPAPAAGQTPSLRFTTLSIDHGLSQNTVTCVLQDRAGFLWLGTQDGLNRFDGYDFAIYRHDARDPTSLPNDAVQALVEDRKGDLWIATDGGGLARWRRADDAFDRHRHRPEDRRSLSSDRLTSLLLDRDGVLWVGTLDAGVNRFDPATGEVERFRHAPGKSASLSDDRVRAIYEDRLGNLWVGTLNGLNLIDRASGKVLRYHHRPEQSASLSDDRVRSILEDRTGALWIGTFDGLNRFDRAMRTFVHFRHQPDDPASLSHNLVRALFEDHDGHLWVGTDAGLDLYRPQSGGFLHYRHDPADAHSLAGDRVMSLAQDRSGVLWIGTQGGGVSRWNANTWSMTHYRRDPAHPDGLSSNQVFALSEDGAGVLWIGTDKGLDAFDRRAGRIEHFRHRPGDASSLSDDRVVALLHDRRGVLWAGTMAGGLNRLEPGSRRFRHYRHDPADPTSLGQDGVMSLFEDSLGNLWAGTFGGGLNRFDRITGRFQRWRHDPDDPTSLSGDRVTCLAEGPPGVLWAGTEDGGLNRLELASGAISRLQHDPADPASLSSNAIWALHVDRRGDLWIGTRGGGLHKLDPAAGGTPALRHYDQRDGLPDDVISGIASDHAGHLWLATNNGLARFDPVAERFERFTTSHGLQSREFNFGAHFQSDSGELFFGGVGGFNAFFPQRIARRTTPPPIVLTALWKLDRPIDLGRPTYAAGAIDLTHRDRLVSFEFAALDFVAPEENRYAYKLEGLTDDWVDLGPLRRVTLTNLDPGRYVLRVRASNGEGVWNEAGLALPITVVPPPWRAPWAWALYAVASSLVLLASAWAYRSRVRRREALRHARQARRAAEEASRAKGTFLAKMSHELRTPMTGVIAMTELLLQTRPRPDQAHHLETIRLSGEAMMRILNDILDFSKIEAGMLEMERAPFALRTCVEEALELLAPKAADQGLELAYWLEESVPQSLIGDGTRTRQVLVNLLGNAVKFTAEGEILVTVKAHKRDQDGAYEVRFAVQDSGVGIPPEKLDRLFQPFSQLHQASRSGGSGLGLAISKQLCEAMGGRIWVDSVPGEGSRFQFTIVAPAAGAEPCPLHARDPALAGKRLQIASRSPALGRVLTWHANAWGAKATAIDAAAEVATALRAGRLDGVIVDRAAAAGERALADEIETLCRARDVPLVVLTTVAEAGDATAAAHRQVLAKPLKPARLQAALRHVLDAAPALHPPRLTVVGGRG